MIFLYCLLFFATPLIYSPFNSELFEVPKMYFIYALTLAILALHLYGWIRGKHPLFRSTLLTLPLLLFLTSQVISTIFSIDIRTSLFGYYSRLNGGLISTVCYLLLFLILSVHITDSLKSKIINYSLASGLIIAIYGIAEHFGIDKSYWVQDVQARVFSTLGQPNWLAAYLCLLLPFSIFKSLESFTQKKYLLSTFYFLLFTFYYICLLFTKSKTGILTALVCLFLFFVLSLIQKQKNKLPLFTFYFLLFTLTLIITNPIKDSIFFTRQSLGDGGPDKSINVTPSQDIRKIVWQGALDLSRQYPLLGTGVETFAYSYYWVRPASHNLTSEWDFLYNKAHDEYLNFAATTGTFGLLTYLILVVFIFFSIFRKNIPITISFISILVNNLTGFSIVITSLYFFLLPALALNQNNRRSTIDHRRSFLFLILIIPLFLLLQISKLFIADICFAKASSLDSQNQLEPALTQIFIALRLSPNEPEYLISAGSITAKLAVASINSDLKKLYSSQSLQFTELALATSPANTNFWKQSAQNYYYLSVLDPKMLNSSINSLEQVIKLAPTDAKSFYLLGHFNELNKNEAAAVGHYQQAIALKSNYDHALFNLGKIYFNQKKYSEARQMFESALQIAPTNTDAKNYLDQIAKLKIEN